tara:strand:+ start:756 stop:1109 length:354 start_codon:yes stop_codon:yes gene_type:complete
MYNKKQLLNFQEKISCITVISANKLTRVYHKEKKYCTMVTITTKRGTSTKNTEVAKNWAGETFKNFQNEQLQKAGSTMLVTKRGTSTIQANKFPNTSVPDTKGQKITTNRGTSIRTL